MLGLDLLAAAILLLAMYQPLLGHLGRQPFQVWDEARLSLNALEMYKDWEWLTPTFGHNPDMWNTKPPLLIWLQALSFKMFGLNEVSFRIPSAIAAVGTTLLLAFFCSKYIKSQLFGVIVAMVLITSNGYIVYHGARHGDYDATLCFWTTLAALSFFAFTIHRNTKFIYLLTFALIGGIWTKGVAIFMIGPGLLIFSVYSRTLLPLLRSRHLYISIALILIFGVGYYPLRELVNPGYLAAVWENELGGRYLEVNSNHSASFWYYIKLLWSEHYSYWLPFAILGIIITATQTNIRLKRLGAFAAMMGVSFLIVISTAKTKLAWYDIPMYPFLAILSGLAIYQFFLWLRQSDAARWIPAALVIICVLMPYRAILTHTYQPSRKLNAAFYGTSYYMQDAFHGKVGFEDQLIAFEGYGDHLVFYAEGLRDMGFQCDFTTAENLPIGTVVAAFQPGMVARIETTYDTAILGEYGEVRKYKITGLKN